MPESRRTASTARAALTKEDLAEFKKYLRRNTQTASDVLRLESLSQSIEAILNQRDLKSYISAVYALSDDMIAVEGMSRVVVRHIEKKILASQCKPKNEPHQTCNVIPRASVSQACPRDHSVDNCFADTPTNFNDVD